MSCNILKMVKAIKESSKLEKYIKIMLTRIHTYVHFYNSRKRQAGD